MLHIQKMAGGKGKDSESSGDEKKRTLSPAATENTDSQDSGRRSRRKKPRVIIGIYVLFKI